MLSKIMKRRRAATLVSLEMMMAFRILSKLIIYVVKQASMRA